MLVKAILFSYSNENYKCLFGFDTELKKYIDQKVFQGKCIDLI